MLATYGAAGEAFFTWTGIKKKNSLARKTMDNSLFASCRPLRVAPAIRRSRPAAMAFLRLLQRKLDGEIVFREPTSGEVPAYAILSHTWGEEEVTYQELKKGKNKSKTVNNVGWRKIQFCAEQAKEDGLEYFWVDTCCIDRKNAVELEAATNSILRWYQNAARCYVYLTDVSKPDTGRTTSGLGKKLSRRVDGSIEVGRCRSSSHQS